MVNDTDSNDTDSPEWPAPSLGLVGRRCLQYLLDTLIVAVPVFTLFVEFLLWVVHLLLHGAPRWLTYLPPALFLVLLIGGFWTSEAWWAHRHQGRTPAMGWLGLRVVTATGEVPSLGALTARWLLVIVDGHLFGLVGVVFMLVTRRRQRFGDLVTRTVVVRDNRG